MNDIDPKSNRKNSFNKWIEVNIALENEIRASQEKVEISLFDGKRFDKNENFYYYSFTLNENDNIDQIV